MRSPGIEEKVAFLSRPEVYPVATQRVEIRETHMSWVFLTDTQAWKLKKPVKYEYLDFSTPEARRRDCEEEVGLNRRLAPDVYLGVAPLLIDPQGNLTLTGEGEPVDWLVRMRRLPADRMLDRAIADHGFSRQDLQKVGSLLAKFYLEARGVEITPEEYRGRLLNDIRANLPELIRPEYEMDADLVRSITSAQIELLTRHADLIDERVRLGRIIDGHGDLRPEHICLERDPVIIDCLEFNRDFRIIDSASELAYLAMECERLGAKEAGEIILQACFEGTGDRPPDELLSFYKSFHGSLRAKIALWHLRDDGIKDKPKWVGRGRGYLRLAAGITVAT
ncbi:MAG: hypothetical protein IPM66_07855 [Acidobacteriota bacterium]|nr:MAG: hypothetical protein IPM66_07855 [Acidobacteriota bacterium]